MSATVSIGCKMPHGLHLSVAGMLPKRVTLQGVGRGKGFSVTPGVPADFWEAWIAQNSDAPFVIRGFVFALPDAAVANGGEEG